MTVDDRLAVLAAEYDLGAGVIARLGTLLDLLAGDHGAFTSVRDPARAVDVHVADALSGLEVAPLRSGSVIADLGSGNGIPGLVLAMALPEARVVLVEAARKKSEFLRRAVEATATANAEVVTSRAEDWDVGIGACDVVVARAVAPLAVLAEYAAPLLHEGGVLVAWKGSRDPVEEGAGATAGAVLGLEPGPVAHVRPFPGARDHHLHLYEKVRPTPDRFPRRAGMAVKRPLAGP